MTITWETNVTEIVWESQTAPGITWTTVVGGTGGGTEIPARRLLPNTVGTPGQIPAVNDEGTAVEYVDAPSGGGVVADAINDGVTTVAPSQNAVYDALALKVPTSRTLAGLDLSADRTASTLRTALSLVPGTDVQAYDADLGQIAAATFADDDFVQKKAGSLTNRTIAQVKADLGIGGSAPITKPKVPYGLYLNPQINFMWSTPGGAYVWWVPVTVECPQAFDAIGLIVQSAGAGVTADFALVGDAGGYPGTVLRSSTGVSLTTAIEAVKVGAFSAISLPVGLVWMAVRIADPNNNCQVASAANTAQQPWGVPYTHFKDLPPYPNGGAHTSYGGGYKSDTVLSSIPTTAPSGMAGLARNSPLPGLRAASW